MYREEAALDIARSFINHYRKFDPRFPSIQNIQKSKWWLHFLRAADQRSLHKDWNSNIWVRCQFDKYEKILPFQLYGKKAEEAFNEYKFRYFEGEQDRQKQLILSILSTYNLIKTWCKKNNNDIIDYKKFFEENEIKLNRNELSEYFLSVCKPYQEFVDDKEKFQLRRAVVHKNKKLKEKLMDVMGSDFY
jgi:hypothetical protein